MPPHRLPRGWWRNHPHTIRLDLIRHYRALEGLYGTFHSRLTREQAKLTSEAWWQAQHASGTAIEVAAKRATGRGRRPKQAATNTQMKRSALTVGTYGVELDRLARMVGPRPPLTDAEIHADAMRRIAALPDAE